MKWLQRACYTAGIVCLLLIAFYRFWFLRQPQRSIPNNPTVFVAPANGKVVSVKTWNSESLIETKGDNGAINVWTKDVDTAGTIISIQMTPLNVHYQRAPQSGKLLAEKYTEGDFNNAIVMSNDYGIRFENEHNEMLFETETGVKYKVIQIAGFVARRIEDYLTPQQSVKQGDVIGLIKLGSQVTIILPYGIQPVVKVGDVTIDGETVIATE
ncbi:MAG: phosphatidylserine decarboxylase family protein [Chitinophagales bacterium]|nr:phosphatidylserine decarboxylase family protein [Chitinophagales bacterium]